MKICTAVLSIALVATTGASAYAQGNNFSSKDKMFLKDSTQDSLAEIEMANIALKQSQDPDIQKFAQQMITDHQKLIDSSKPIAMQAGVTPPTAPMQKDEMMAKKLSKMSGKAFDDNYVHAMVEGHAKALKLTQDENSSTQNGDLKSATDTAVQVISQHKQEIDQMAQQRGIATAGM